MKWPVILLPKGTSAPVAPYARTGGAMPPSLPRFPASLFTRYISSNFSSVSMGLKEKADWKENRRSRFEESALRSMQEMPSRRRSKNEDTVSGAGESVKDQQAFFKGCTIALRVFICTQGTPKRNRVNISQGAKFWGVTKLASDGLAKF